MRKSCYLTGFKPEAFGLPTALPLKLWRMSSRMLNFGYLKPVVDNNLIVMF